MEESIESLILEVQDRIAHYAKQGKGAQEALEKLKRLHEMLQDVQAVEDHLVGLGKLAYG